ncbi:sodium:solute symporter [Aquirufa rosea]|uniref:Sodium:solute symporter n=1 Tax=Aquirufa rosea TaxID=2509241 RepID=A0A4Q1C0C2_9BACT|nr:sodium:solute symporter [Aquirufa rosea]RXK49872.1 sodium:solute symporter [Aquirufa rosea]
MHLLDWLVLVLTIGGIVLYGSWKGREAKHSLKGFLLADRELPWYHILLSVMATQASAITFLSVPGQAYTDGMRFVQFYLGLPIAMIVLSVTFIPQYYHLKIYTAYQFLEERFDSKTRILTSFLFLIPRALSTGVTIAAPSIILSTLLGWDLTWTNGITAAVVTFYCILGGSKTISYTQLLQMGVVLAGMVIAGIYIILSLPEEIGMKESLQLAGKMGKINLIDWKFDINNRYTIWSGIIGGFFLQLSYFGTDQSQVGRYLTGHTANESKKGLLLNGFLKIPMQFFILLVGILVFVFYQFNQAPIFFNKSTELHWETAKGHEAIDQKNKAIFLQKKEKEKELIAAINQKQADQIPILKSQILDLHAQQAKIKEKAVDLLKSQDVKADSQDTNYIFLRFIVDHLPIGLVGFLIAMILLASMGSMASAFGSLTSTVMVDIYQRFIHPHGTNEHYWWSSKMVTLAWGIFCLIVAQFSVNMGSLIEVVNILGSWFYGTILGVFLCAFYLPKTQGGDVFWAAIIAEAFVIYAWKIDLMAFLWLNVLGCVMVVILAFTFQWIGQITQAKP